VILLLTSPAGAETITSTATGGSWSQGSTWVGGAVPNADDDVIIAGPVIVDISSDCHHLTVLPAGELYNAIAPTLTLSAGGNVLNQGSIRDNVYTFTIAIGGDLSNEAEWILDKTLLTGTSDRQFSMTPASDFASTILFAPGAGGDVNVTTPISITGTVDVEGGRMLLGPDCPFTIAQGFIAGELLASGNTIFFEPPTALLWDCTVDNAVVDGHAQTTSNDVHFTGGLTVKGTLQNYQSFGSSFTTIEGTLLNEGEIRNSATYGFTIALTGDLINNGEIRNSQIGFRDGGTYHLSMGEGAVMEAQLYLPEIIEETLFVDTPFTTSGIVGLGIGTMVLEPGSDLTLSGHSILTGAVWDPGTLIANGNEVHMSGSYCSTWGLEIESADVGGYFTIGGDARFTDGVRVVGTLVNRAYNNVDIEIEGLLLNVGSVTENGGSFTVVLLGDAENQGIWDNSTVRVDGEADQLIGTGAGIDVPEFVLDSNIQAAGYQWTRDGIPLPGETDSELTLGGVGASDYGVYRCEGDGGGLSRAITIDAAIVGVDDPGATTLITGIMLAQNHPNPFYATTEFRFSLPKAGPVRLSIYDVSGREVGLLVNRALSAGEHRVDWQPKELGSGVYWYRLQAAGEERIRKAALLR